MLQPIALQYERQAALNLLRAARRMHAAAEDVMDAVAGGRLYSTEGDVMDLGDNGQPAEPEDPEDSEDSPSGGED